MHHNLLTLHQHLFFSCSANFTWLSEVYTQRQPETVSRKSITYPSATSHADIAPEFFDASQIFITERAEEFGTAHANDRIGITQYNFA